MLKSNFNWTPEMHVSWFSAALALRIPTPALCSLHRFPIHPFIKRVQSTAYSKAKISIKKHYPILISKNILLTSSSIDEREVILVAMNHCFRTSNPRYSVSKPKEFYSYLGCSRNFKFHTIGITIIAALFSPSSGHSTRFYPYPTIAFVFHSFPKRPRIG